MIKLQQLISIPVFLFIFQLHTLAQSPYHLTIHPVDDDTLFITRTLGVQTSFPNKLACQDYVGKLPAWLRTKGYMTASIDRVQFDSLSASMQLYLGRLYQWSQLSTGNIDTAILEAVNWRSRQFDNSPMDYSRVALWQQRILNYLENNGYPFAAISLDSVQLEEDSISGSLHLEKGPLYVIDSIRVFGDVKISNAFLQRYLQLENGSIYNKSQLQKVDQKLAELGFLEQQQPSNLTLLGTGSVLNLYLKQRKNSQVNVLIGFLPNNDQLAAKKILITGEANIRLVNALGNAETIGLNWQQLQVKSPRLHLLYKHPFVFNSPLGVDFSFDMFRKDSTFLNVNFQVGAQYMVNQYQSGKIFIQRFQTIVNAVNTNYILQYNALPDEADVKTTNIGVEYQLNNTNYKLNPVRGNEWQIVTAVGSKQIKKNNEILQLKDPNNPATDFGNLYDTVKLKSYQLRVTTAAAHYFPVGRQGTFKTAANGGFLQSENIFRNELFQIGGYNLLRGFDEESQYLSQYLIGTLEYRYLVGINSFFYSFIDGGYGANKSRNADATYTYISTGLGLAFETKVGVFNLSLGVGKRNDSQFNLRQSKIHFGFINYF